MDRRQHGLLSRIHGVLSQTDGAGRSFRRVFPSECRHGVKKCNATRTAGMCCRPLRMADDRGVRRAWARTEWETGNEAAARCAQPPSFCPYALFLSRIIKKLYMIDTQNRIEEYEILDNDLATFKTLWSTAVLLHSFKQFFCTCKDAFFIP